MVVIHLFVSCILMIQPYILEIVLISDIQKNRECLILKFCDIAVSYTHLTLPTKLEV